jgi:hypothetical protein
MQSNPEQLYETDGRKTPHGLSCGIMECFSSCLGGAQALAFYLLGLTTTNQQRISTSYALSYSVLLALPTSAVVIIWGAGSQLEVVNTRPAGKFDQYKANTVKNWGGHWSQSSKTPTKVSGLLNHLSLSNERVAGLAHHWRIGSRQKGY